ncbi:hypothetical protein DAPPUDRAFT_317694 [Daphnia pulex]|uniref:Uncharacterized protein n=1 Tax=Daphnia pulex TaxID=6669 RepID=E9GGQ0_DAPPU|nr:hypothetical protein DAPPUDRAFT_317694 [Daphnia pulex]|eukprot:EFX81430.1 hypothetical protein DAPPUDRAFT_317694 [Daphnia pulex]
MSTLSDSLLCFQHCSKINVFCFTIPNNCPACENELSNTDLTIPPFRVPSPLTSEAKNFSILIKPTFGDFIRDFKRGDVLHIALSNSESKIFEFNENGISSSSFGSYLNWTNFLSVSLATLSYTFSELDKVLKNTITMDTWAAERYDEVNNNCFDYVISVLNAANKNSNSKLTKIQLTQEIISPAINRTIRLLSIVRNVSQNGFFLQGNHFEEP